MKQLTIILNLVLLCSSVILGQEKFPRSLPRVDISQIWHSSTIPEHNMVSDPLIENIINQTNLDSLIAYVRILSGEDSAWIDGSKARIQHRVSDLDNDLAADYLKQKLNTYHLEVHDQVYSATGRNIYGVQSGYLYPDKQYMICAHYDAVANYCADDNASGVAAVLEAARILCRYDFKYTLVYALWDEEEIGFLGSQYYASQARSDHVDILGVLNMDMIGWDSNKDGLFDIHTYNIANSNSLANLLIINNSLYNLSLSPVIYNPGTELSDHSSFWNKDYGAILLIEAYYGDDLNPYYHSSEDRIDKFDVTYFHSLSKLSISAIATVIEITEDTLLVAISPDTGYQTFATNLVIKGIHTNFMVNQETLKVWLSKGAETIAADSVIVQSNTLLTACFCLPKEATTGRWDVNVQTAVDGLLRKENSFEILPAPALISFSPDTLNISLESGAMVSHSLTIHNVGISNLEFKISSQAYSYALQFDGIDDYLDMGGRINLANSSFTLEAWAKRFTIGTDDLIWGQGSAWTNYGLHGGFRDSDAFILAFYDNDLDTPTKYTDFGWHHWACTFEVNTKVRRIYRDGLEVASDIASANYKGSGTFYIGCNPWFNYFGGIIDEVRIWNIARTPSEISSFMNRALNGDEPGLAGCWNFNEATGYIAFDLTNNGNHGVLRGGAEWVSNGAPVASDWLTVVPDSGICMAGATAEVNLYVDARELEAGDYSGLLTISSNDPFNPTVHIPIYVSVTGATGIAQNLTVPKEFKLNQNYPNPFNQKTVISYQLPVISRIELSIYNLLGQKVATLVSEKQPAGYYSVEWDASDFSSSVYFYRLATDKGFTLTKKLVVPK